MTTQAEIEIKKLEIELEKIKAKKQEKFHKFRMEELKIRLEIAQIYRCKTGKKNILKQIKKLDEKYEANKK